ncbi:PAS domain-containing protein [Dokdonia genika]|uniref:PAS domain-containing protein n=1 Tax=Dokdonia genika TaxID=308113 RepID=A0ABV9L4I0_9FLAO
MKKKTIRAIAPLQSWDIFSEGLAQNSIKARKKAEREQLAVFKKKYKWTIDVASITDQDYTTIVVTDHTQHIQWVNAGFSDMTGYPKSYAIGKHPRFLQGAKTSPQIRKEIKTHLSKGAVVERQLLNYKKDGTPYLCDIKIIPLRNSKSEITHFMALEKPARVA